MFDMTQDPQGLPDYSTYPITIFTEFEVDVLFINLPVNEIILSAPIAYIVNVSYNVVGAFFMLNLLATMMGDTQEKVDRAKDEFWRTQVTRLRCSVLNNDLLSPLYIYCNMEICKQVELMSILRAETKIKLSPFQQRPAL